MTVTCESEGGITAELLTGPEFSCVLFSPDNGWDHISREEVIPPFGLKKK